MTTWCLACDNVCASTRNLDPWRWRCIKVAVAPGFGFVHPTHAPDPPYERCSQVNRAGDCEMFEPKRNGSNT